MPHEEKYSDSEITEALAIIDLALAEAKGAYYYEEILLKRSILGDGGIAGNCDLCDECADEGWVDSEEVFASDEDEPPHHPNCTCTVEYKEGRKRVYV